MALDAHRAGQFRAAVAPGMGLLKAGLMLNNILQQRYVLTPDFAFKLLLLNERRKVGQPVILSGDTGVGKTELLRLYSVIINSDSGVVADLTHELTMFVKDSLLCNTKRQPALPEFAEQLAALSVAPPTPGSLLKLITTLCDSPAPPPDTPPPAPATQDQAAPAPAAPAQAENKKFFATIAFRFVAFLKGLLGRYPLIKRTPLLQQVLDGQQPEDVREEDEDNNGNKNVEGGGDAGQGGAIVRSKADLRKLVEEYLNARYTDLFHTILMHQKIDAKQFRAKVQAICDSATYVASMPLQQAVTIVAFVDEFNTSSILGDVKEVFMDHTLDGAPLPPNILWVAAMNRPKQKEEKAKVEEEVEDDFYYDEVRGQEAEKSRYVETKKRQFIEDKRKQRRRTQQLLQRPLADSQNVDFTGVEPQKLESFSVRPPPISMNKLVLDFDSLNERQEALFLQVYFQLKKNEIGTEWEEIELRDFILFGQRFVRNAKIFRVHVSIRDMKRAVKLYIYFRHKRPQLLGPLPKGVANQNNYRHWQALILSISMAYYFRLRVRATSDVRRSASDRESFADEFLMHLMDTQDRHQVFCLHTPEKNTVINY